MESIEPNKIEVGDIFSTTERGTEDKILIMVTNIIQDGKPGIKSVQTRWGTKQYESNGYSLNYKISLDNGETWKYEDGEGHYVDTGWIGELIKMGHWSLEQKNMDLGGDFFDSLTESEEDEFGWVDDIVNQPQIKVGDVYYIVDGVFGTDVYPMDYKPEKVRYLFHVTKVFEKNGDFYLEYEYCNFNRVTYNPKDYNSSRCNYYDDDAYGSKIKYQEALNLINNSYWRLMGNNGKGINESEEFDWLPDQNEIGLKVRVNGKPFHVKDPIHRQDEGIFKSRCSWSGCYEIVDEEIFTGIDCYIVKLDEGYPEVYFPKRYFSEEDFCGLMNENIEETSDCVGINLSNLTTDEKIKVLEKLELIYNTFIGFSQYAWVDQIQYLITDFTTPVTMPLKGRRNQCGRWFTSVPENAYKEETDSYEVPISMDGTKLRWSKEIDGREFLNMSFIDDTSNLFESEEDFGWVDNLDTEPFHHQLMRDNLEKRGGHPVDVRDVRYIMFNPTVEVGDKKFNKVAYFLEDNDYYPESLEPFGKKTSYIKITRFKDERQNGRWDIGPELSEQELYNFSQTKKDSYWAEEFFYVKF